MYIVDLDKLSEMFWDGNFMEIHKDDIPSIPSAFEGMTNGEVIQTLFPDLGVCSADSGAIEYANSDVNIMASRKWLESPYKKGGEE